jgi:hypothetical protein
VKIGRKNLRNPSRAGNEPIRRASASQFSGDGVVLRCLCWIDYTVEMMKRAALVALLFSLALFEIYVCMAFLSFHRQETYAASMINDGLFFLAIFLSFTLVAIGAICFVLPSTMQDYALKQNHERFSTNPFLDWMKTANYLRFLRFIGIVAFVAGIFAAFVLLKRLWETAFI